MRISPSTSRPTALRRAVGCGRTRNRIVLLGLALATVVGVSACSSIPGLTVEQIPLPAPGGTGKSISLHATFDNALNLPTRAKVKLNGTDVGQVTDIKASNYKAKVTMKVSTSSRSRRGPAPSCGKRPRWATYSSRCCHRTTRAPVRC